MAWQGIEGKEIEGKGREACMRLCVQASMYVCLHICIAYNYIYIHMYIDICTCA